MANVLELTDWNLTLGACFAAVVWLLCRTKWLSRRPALCHGLWLLVLLKLVAPAVVGVPILPASARATVGQVETAAKPPALEPSDDPRRGELAATSPASASGAGGAAAPDTVLAATAKPAEAGAIAAPALAWRQKIPLLLLGMSLSVSAFIWLLAARQFVRVERVLGQAGPAPERARVLLRELAPQFGCRRAPALVVVDQPIMPMLWAAPGRATIVLPRQVAEGFDDDQLRSVLGHELAHLARRDGLSQLFAFFVTSLPWWNPCAWLARREMRAAAEACSDALVLERLPGLRKSYARSLLTIVDFVALGKPLHSAWAVAFGESRSLRKRIVLVADGGARSRISKAGWALLACGAFVLVSFPTRAQEKPGPAPTSTAIALADESVTAERSEVPSDRLKRPENVMPNQIAGVVVDSDGKPLAGVLVDAWTWFTGDEIETDQDGVFRFPPGDEDSRNVELRFSKPGYSPHYIVQQPRGVQDLVVKLGNSTFIEGIVRGPDRRPVAGATVKGEQGEYRGDGFVIGGVTTKTTSDPKGYYRMHVFPDTYEMQVVVPRVGVARVSGVTVAPDQAKALDIELKKGVRFEASVVDAHSRQPVEKLVLFNWRENNVRGVSDAQGKIVIEGMLPGKYEFSVGQGEPKTMHGLTYYQHGELGRWWSPDAVNPWERKTIEANRWQRNFDRLTFNLTVGMQPVAIEVEQGVVFAGHVYDPDGNPVEGATVAPARTGSGNSLTGDTRYSEKTAKDGSYRAVMPAGNEFTYNLVAHDGDYETWRHWANAVSEPLKTEPGQHVDKLDFKLTRGATVRGRVIVDGDRVVGNHKVHAHAADLRENRYYDPTVNVREDGTFELKFIRPGKQYIQVDPFWLRAAENPQGTSVLVDLKPDEVREGIELHVAPTTERVQSALATRKFRVTLLDAAGQPAVNKPLAIAPGPRPLDLSALIGNRQDLATELPKRLEKLAIGGHSFTTNSQGMVEIPGQQLFDEHTPAVVAFALSADPQQAAIGNLFADAKNPEITLRMGKLCEVTLAISSEKLPGDKKPPQAYLFSGPAMLLATEIEEGKLVVQLPAGEYKLTVVRPSAEQESVSFVGNRSQPGE
jgi:beta-lactamase regulating signal transducer with metallopeptidase domain